MAAGFTQGVPRSGQRLVAGARHGSSASHVTRDLVRIKDVRQLLHFIHGTFVLKCRSCKVSFGAMRNYLPLKSHYLRDHEDKNSELNMT